jgi:hypothetical protein
MSSLVESPVTRKEKAVLYDYLIALNEDISSTDDPVPPASTEHASSSATKEKTLPAVPPILDSPEYLDPQDSQDPYSDIDDDHYINWEGRDLFWDVPFSQKYYNYHNT